MNVVFYARGGMKRGGKMVMEKENDEKGKVDKEKTEKRKEKWNESQRNRQIFHSI